jgi:hypothetical protein
MIKRLLVALSIVVLLFVFASHSDGASATSVRQVRPANTDCVVSFPGCYAWEWWDGTAAQGVSAIMEMNGLNHFYWQYGYYQKFVAGWGKYGGIDGGAADIHAGQEIDMPHSGICNGNGTYESGYWFVLAWNSSHSLIKIFCQAMLSGDYAKNGTIIIKHYSSSGGGILVWITGAATRTIPVYISYANGAQHNYLSIGHQVEIHDYVGGHEVWGLYDSYWEWMDNGGTFHLIDRIPDGNLSDYPPNVGWVHVPSPSYPGGLGISCAYESGTVCYHLS